MTGAVWMQGDGNEGVFTERDELLQTEACSANAQLAELMQDSFACLCDVKQSGDDVYYRLNDAKVQPHFLGALFAQRESLAAR